jgi:hypothetical protein
MRNPKNIKKTLNQVYVDKKNVDDFLVESIRKPSLDFGLLMFLEVYLTHQVLRDCHWMSYSQNLIHHYYCSGEAKIPG